MEKTNRIYSNEQMDVIIGHLKGTMYVRDTQAVLKERGKNYSEGHVQRVFGKFTYSEPVWDALKTVALARQQKKRDIEQAANQLVEPEVA